jgi:hypothetical protein
MSYRVLVLPDTTRMTPVLLRKVRDLAAAGAMIVGPTRPAKSPGLSDYPKCDAEVTRFAGELWGQGRIVTDKTPEQVLAGLGLAEDFSAPPFIRWIHRQAGGTEIYFVASNSPQPRTVTCTFRVAGLRPEFWRPETGEIEPVPVYEQTGDMTRIPISFGPSGSVFVVYRQGPGTSDPIVSVTRDGRTVVPAPVPKGDVRIEKAVYGLPGDPKRLREVRTKLQAIVEGGESSFQVSRLAAGDDPAYGIVKTLEAEVHYGDNGKLLVEAWQAGPYALKTASGRILRAQAPALPPPLEISGPWELRFPPNWGAPIRVALDRLISWSEHGDPGVKYFSGQATYTKTITVPGEMIGKDRRIYLDLGKVQVIAKVKLNGQDLGILWKPPYRQDVTGVLRAGGNTLEISVANLWINRMIGDEQLPEDSDRNPDGTLKAWPRWVQEGKPSPTGRFTFTSWRLWRKGEAPVESGLLGPVMLRVSALAKVGT